MGKRVLITGAGGFIGNAVLEDLSADPHLEITALDITFSTDQLDNHPNVYFANINITHFDKLEILFNEKDFDFVIHLSAILSKDTNVDSAKKIYDVNVNGTTNIALLSSKKESKLIFLSTAMVYGNVEGPFTETNVKNPSGYYAISKSIGEDIIFEENSTHKLEYVIFRPSVIYGPKQKGGMFIPSVCEAAIQGENFGMTEGNQKRDFVYIDDVVSAINLAIKKEKMSGIFNLSSGETTLLSDVPSYVKEEVTSFKVEFGKVPYRDNEIWDYSLNNEKLTSYGWCANSSLKEGLTKVLNYKKGEVK